MKLTGKCKEDFENWWMIQPCNWGTNLLRKFYELDQAMQYGVYVDFFDSVGIVIGLNSTFGFAGRQIFRLYVGADRHQSRQDNPSTRIEARTKAIEKANEIYNT